MRVLVATVALSLLPVSMAYGQKPDTAVSALHGVPMRLVQTITLPSTVKGNVDHFAIDLKRNRLFATPEDFKAVLVFDLAQDKPIHQIDGTERPHAVLYRQDTDRMYVAAPQGDTQSGRVLIFEPLNTGSGEVHGPEPQEAVNAPSAEGLVRDILSSHSYLRKMGLHVIPPSGRPMILIANGNATRLGIHTSPGDFAAVKDGKTYGPYNPDGNFYNMKMLMFDAQGRKIGILVMEIPSSTASSEKDAARLAEAIRKELADKIPSLDKLFQLP